MFFSAWACLEFYLQIHQCDGDAHTDRDPVENHQSDLNPGPPSRTVLMVAWFIVDAVHSRYLGMGSFISLDAPANFVVNSLFL